jgi:hypothetical protein
MKLLPAALLFLYLALPAFADPDVQAFAGDLKEVRSTGADSSLQLQLHLVSSALAGAASVKVTITKCFDDTGRDLIDPDKTRPVYETIQPSMKNDQPVSVTLLDSARAAKSIKDLEGQADFIEPGLDPSGAVKIPHYRQFTGAPLDLPALRSAGIVMTILTADQYAAVQQKAQSAPNPRAFFSKAFAPGFNPAPGATDADFVFQYQDPNHALGGIEFRNKAGAKIALPDPSTSTSYVFSGQQATETVTEIYAGAARLPKAAQLYLVLNTAQGTKSASFTVTNIPLP